MTDFESIPTKDSKLSAAPSSWFDSAAWFRYADVLAALAAAMLPWSTTGFAILFGVWLVSLIPRIPTVELRDFLRLLARPICLWPLAIFALAVVGVLWSDAPWTERLQGIKPVVSYW